MMRVVYCISGWPMSSISSRFPSVIVQPPADSLSASPALEGTGEDGSTFRELVSQSMRRTSVNGLRTDPHHMALPDARAVDPEFDHRAMGILAQRQQLIASNIANADTPNYKSRDFDLRAALEEANRYQVSALPMSTNSALHQPGSVQRNVQALALKYHQAGQGSVDGNTVDMDAERAKFAENSIRFQFELEQVKHEGQELARALGDPGGR